jgi:hypothetical protein
MSAPTQTAYINPDIHDASGALRCAEGSAIFVIATRRQIERLRVKIQRELGNVPVVQHVTRFEMRVAQAAHRCNSLVDEHIRHARTQHELANDENLRNAADGYLAARSRGPVQLALPAGGARALPAGGTSAAIQTYEVNGEVRGPRGAAKAMRNAADALGIGQAGALTTMYSRLRDRNVEGRSPQLLIQIREELVLVRKVGLECADEFARQVRKMQDKIAADPALRNTQTGWLRPGNDL